MKYRFYSIAVLSLFSFTLNLSAQEKTTVPVKKKDVFTKKPQEKNGFEGIEPDIGVLVEFISLDHKTANQLLGKFAAKATDVTEMRDKLEQMIDQGSATLVETLWVWARSGQRAKTESIKGVYYPSEYDPPVIPNTLGNIVTSDPVDKQNNPSQTNIHLISAMPSAFEGRNVGSMLEVDPVLSSDHKLIKLNLAPEIVTQLEDHYFTRKGFEGTAHGVEHISMPTFYAIKATAQIEVTPGKYNLLGIHTPPDDPDKKILVLVRADLISFD